MIDHTNTFPPARQSTGFEVQCAGLVPAAGLSWITPCHACGCAVEAFESEWCKCITQKPSLACRSCGACLCAVPTRSTLFWFRAPAELVALRAAEGLRRRSTAAHLAPTEQTDVLIVDDDAEIRDIASYMVGHMGYRVATAVNAEEALVRIAGSAPRVVLSDALMPKIDGRYLCRLIKAADANIKVIIMTSLYTAAHHKYEAFKTFMADDYLPKPIDFLQLQGALERLAPAVPA